MSFEYDGVGNRTKRTDYNGAVTTYQYNNLNRLTGILYGSTSERPTPTTIYHGSQPPLTMPGTVAFTYDNRSRSKPQLTFSTTLSNTATTQTATVLC
jgi:RHS Repeat.